MKGNKLSIVKPQKSGVSEIPHEWILDERLSALELGILIKATIFNNVAALAADFYLSNQTRYNDPKAVLESALIQLERFGYLEPGQF
jgi:hypothetical protein